MRKPRPLPALTMAFVAFASIASMPVLNLLSPEGVTMCRYETNRNELQRILAKLKFPPSKGKISLCVYQIAPNARAGCWLHVDGREQVVGALLRRVGGGHDFEG